MLLLVAWGTLGACRDVAPGPNSPPSPSAGEPTSEVFTSVEQETLTRIIAAERSVALTGFKKTVHGEPGKHRETEFRVVRAEGGPTVLEWQAGGAPSGRAWSYDDRYTWFEHPRFLLQNYRVELVEEGPSVAWRATRQVTLSGRRPGRPSLTLLCDRETWVILREEFRDPSGAVRLTSVFESVTIGSTDAESDDRTDATPDDSPLATHETAHPETTVEFLEDAIDNVGATNEGTPPEALPFIPLRVSDLPAGFRSVETRTTENESVEYWSDGLAAFLVRQSPAPAGAEEGQVLFSDLQGRSSFEAVFAGIAVEVTGYVPADRLEDVLRGLRVPSR